MDSAKEQVKEQVVANKKILYLLGAVLVFGAYMLYPTASPVETDGGVDDELANLQASRSNTPSTPQAVFDGVDRRNISLGSGSGEADSSLYTTNNQALSGEKMFRGTVVGYGIKSDSKGQYLNLYVTDEGVGFEIDLRRIVGYDTQASRWREGDAVVVYGELSGGHIIRARVVQ